MPAKIKITIDMGPPQTVRTVEFVFDNPHDAVTTFDIVCSEAERVENFCKRDTKMENE